ncbi:hypothetical protein CK505_12520 [Kocuria sp. WN036]|uniref:hypothetical protein n=1 Tax=Kocuria sp. WN036 TaxID=2032628 RepID=UPI000BAB7181|nr:hypothetical protein [Kocuria sp. WN036]PAU90097.1 hypothetical protein CK505_12520 [Kocuria sp. WN036]
MAQRLSDVDVDVHVAEGQADAAVVGRPRIRPVPLGAELAEGGAVGLGSLGGLEEDAGEVAGVLRGEGAGAVALGDGEDDAGLLGGLDVDAGLAPVHAVWTSCAVCWA